MLRKWPPEHLLGCFLYQTELFFQTKASGNLQIVREGQNLKILGKKKFENSKFEHPRESYAPRPVDALVKCLQHTYNVEKALIFVANYCVNALM